MPGPVETWKRPRANDLGRQPGCPDGPSIADRMSESVRLSPSDRPISVGVAAAGAARDPAILDLLGRCNGDLELLSAKKVGEAAIGGNQLAQQVLRRACQVLGWGIAQVVTLFAPEMIVVGGGVSLIGDKWFFEPLREEVSRYVFPPLADSFQIVPARLGELVVVHGALALARMKDDT